VDGSKVAAIALDTTGSSVVPVSADMEPLDDYYLWCDHRSWREAAEITAKAHEYGLEAIKWCGGVYSSEWGFSKLLHWLRHNPDKRDRLASAFEHCDMVAAVLCGITNPANVKRSVCAMGHKWMWNASLGGLPPEEFLCFGPQRSAFLPAFPSRLERLTLIGTRSARGCGLAMW
jgi:L-ribulokinase